jgi:eukaryotic-like serine/threonine-protein kinase
MLLRRLAAGGMAEVYLARIAGAGGVAKLVAIKRIHPNHAADEGFGAMLLDEAKLAVSLSHRNIVQTLNVGRIDGSYFIVMEHVDGHDAGQVLDALRRQGRRFPIDLAAHVIAEVCRGLDYAHRHLDGQGESTSIVHRDVSPQNVLFSFAGEVKLLDFGIAKTRSRRSDPDAGVIKGKYFYMSPEQAWAEPLDQRSDIFSAGIVLWELLVGERLHRASDVQSVLDAVRRAEVPVPSSLRKDVPEALDAIVARATALNADERFACAGAMADALVAYLAGRPPSHASVQIAEMLAGLSPPSPARLSRTELETPHTRDRVVTQIMPARSASAEPPLDHDLEEGAPTSAGWLSPGPGRRLHAWLWVLGASSLLVGLLLWRLACAGSIGP